MALLYNQKFRTAMLLLLLAWATTFFWLINPVFSINLSFSLVSVFACISILYRLNEHFIIIYLSFIATYVLQGYMLMNNLPAWLIMIGLLVVLVFLLASFGRKEQNPLFDRRQKVVFLIITSLILLELFIFLGYFLISPMNRSVIISSALYFIYGFQNEVMQKQNLNLFKPYLLVFLAIFATIILTASWGNF